jgi:hypothetical protein
MMAKRVSDPIGAYVRRAKAERRTAGRKCSNCGEADPQKLIAKSTPLRCAACVAIATGRPIYEDHHPAGRINNPTTVRIPLNDHHGVLTPAMYEWPIATRENPDQSPVLAAAACLRGLYDTLVYLLGRMLLTVAEFLELLDQALRIDVGAVYWLSPSVIGETDDEQR